MDKRLIIFLAFSSLLISEEVKDPFEGFNRVTFEFNETLDRTIAKPTATFYAAFPKPVKKSVTNFFDNLEELNTSVNQVLQGKPLFAINDISRFLINSTIGIGGIFDVATAVGLNRHEEDFGQTLALWGVPSGPYLMLPVLGPSTLRDTLARPVSSFLSVTFHMTESDVEFGLKLIDALETRERLLEVESLLSGDKYYFVRDSYIQYLDYEIKDGKDIKDNFMDDMDDFLIE
jgi:phospholipid-binding lipoprotein MlaA|tara:strand:- start:8464 stop:9159 length:696 start_codon:yes stop_codon:yes gene_type:complete